MTERIVTLPTDPPCPKCGRRYAVHFTRPREQTTSLRCVGVPTNPGCGHEWRPK